MVRDTCPSQNVKQHLRFAELLAVELFKKARRCGANTFQSENLQSTSASQNFWQLSCSKSACRCGANTFRSQQVKSTPASQRYLEVRYQSNNQQCVTENTVLPIPMDYHHFPCSNCHLQDTRFSDTPISSP